MEPPKELHELAVGMSLLELTEDMASVAGEMALQITEPIEPNELIDACEKLASCEGDDEIVQAGVIATLAIAYGAQRAWGGGQTPEVGK